ncbi:MAG TPA: GNAT family N-acetyltransferase [Candidatus Saccharimonadales bacterium]|nr:GNAT family N-acetyltransferase [Candidatus Saccharimonadales bacterium]
MKPTEPAAGQFEVVSISELATLEKPTRDSAIETYRQAFAREPYNEAFTTEEAEGALEYILEQKGDLVIGKLGTKAVALAGGRRKADDTYYIEELAVAPEVQGKGYGRATLTRLLETAKAPSYEIRTTVRNEKAISLYTSSGFTEESGTEVVAQHRQDGRLALDERVYLSKPPLPEQERRDKLKRAVIAYPSGNTTAIVFDQFLDGDRKKLNEQVMQTWKALKPEQPEIEQCCFVTLPRNPNAVARVEMFGGEFCGNATRSVAWLITKGQDYRGLIEVSGVERPLEFSVKDGQVAVEMPLPEAAELVQSVPEGSLVQLDGIAQLVVTNPKDVQTPRQLLTDLLRTNKYGLADQPAVGVSYYDEPSGKAEFCVWVNAIDTIFDETACGSGTCAIGVAESAKTQQPVELTVVQPSGESIRTETQYANDAVTKSFISGEVAVLYDGELKLS